MTVNAKQHSRIVRRKGGPKTDRMSVQAIKSPMPFFFLTVYVVSFFLHSGERFPVIAPLRPDLLSAALVILSVFPYIRQKVILLRLPPARALTALIIVVILTTPFTQWPGSVIRDHWQPFIKAILFFYFTVLVVDTPKRLRIFLAVFLGCQIVRVMEPLYLHLSEGYYGSATYLGGGEFAGRLAGAPADVINPNGLGFVIATLVVFLHFMLGQSKRAVLKLAYVLIVPPVLYALILSMSRGGFIALLVGGWLIFRQSSRKGLLVIVAIAAAIGAWSVMSDVQKDRYLSLVTTSSSQSGSAEGRIRGMMNEFKLGFNRPIFGHGLGTTREAKVHFGGGREASHNLYAEVMIELGIVGLIFYLIFLFRIYETIKGQFGTWRNSTSTVGLDDYFARLHKACAAIFWVYAVYSFNYFGLSQDYWYIFGGLCVALSTMSLSDLTEETLAKPRFERVV